MSKKNKVIPVLLTGIALAIGVAISNAVIQNSFVLDEVRATNSSVTITASAMGGVASLGTANYADGAERTATISGIGFGGKAISANQNNTPSSGATAGQYIQTQALNGVVYNTSAFSGRIVSISVTKSDSNAVVLHCGSTARLVNSTKANYTINGGTQISSQSTTSITWNLDSGTNYTYPN